MTNGLIDIGPRVTDLTERIRLMQDMGLVPAFDTLPEMTERLPATAVERTRAAEERRLELEERGCEHTLPRDG